MMLWRLTFSRLCLACLFGWALPAAADVWGYVDAKGVAHFANDKLDERYELFFKGGESFSTDRSDGSLQFSVGKAVTLSPQALATGGVRAPTKLLAFFDASPNHKAVRHLLKDAAKTHSIDYELLQALIATESGFNTFAVSPKGAVGLMQLMPPTAERYGVKADKLTPIEIKLTDPKTNIKAGATYLRDLIKMFPGQLDLALAAYNAGEGAVQRAGNKIPNYPETRNYVKTVMQLYGHLKPPAAVIVVEDTRKPSGRVRMEMMGGTTGTAGNAVAQGRSNMPPMMQIQPPNPLVVSESPAEVTHR